MLKQTLTNYLKNIPGWRTKQKLVLISVDDYGNVRLDSKKARESMDKAGLKVHSRFDAYDTLETREDLEALFDVLTSVRDAKGNYPVFTPYTLTHNVNFEKMNQNGYKEFESERLVDSFKKLESLKPKDYNGAWQLWEEGVKLGIFIPQFHGREHFNLISFEHKLEKGDFELLTSLKNRSLTSISSSGIPNIGWTAAFSFNHLKETESFPNILKDGINAFEEIFGFRSTCFTPPAQQFPKQLEAELLSLGVTFIDKPFYRLRHLGNDKYKKEINWTGRDDNGLKTIVRNVVFEPTDSNIDHVAKAMKQIEAAFNLGKPAHISSHRVNFCGLIDHENRDKSLSDLKQLLSEIILKWPDVEFVSVAGLCEKLEEL